MDALSPNDDPLCLVFIPALVAILHRMETDKGLPLTEAEVIDITNRSVCVKMRYSHALALEEKRGYRDIRPEQCWEDWQQVRTRLTQHET